MNDEMNIPNNIEIDQALKEFEAKQAVEQMQKAPEVSKDSNIPKMVQLVMRYFRVEQKQAEYILLGFVIVMIIISLFLVFGAGFMEKKNPSAFLEQMQKMQEVPVNQ